MRSHQHGALSLVVTEHLATFETSTDSQVEIRVFRAPQHRRCNPCQG